MKKNINLILKTIVGSLKKLEPKKNKDGEVISPKAIDYANEILKQSSKKIIFHNGRIWVYDKGTFYAVSSKERTNHFVKLSIMRLDGVSNVPVAMITAVREQLMSEYYELETMTDENITFINMKSNVLAIQKNGKVEILAHDEKYNFTYQLHYDYDPDAKAPVFEKFLQTSLGDDELIQVIEEYLGYVLNFNAKKHEKILFLYGDGSNGKSTLLNIIKRLFGIENVSYVELSEMGAPEKVALMDGKILNISSDAKKNGLDTSAFKKIVSGEPVLGKFLFKDVYTIEQLPKLIAAMNRLPYNSGDNSFGFYRRLLTIPFTKIIEEADKDYELESKVIKNELPAILNMAIAGMCRLDEQGKFTEAQVMTELMNTYKESSNHVPTFLQEEQYEVLPEGVKKGTALSTIYGDFKQWCLKYGYNPYSATYLSNELDHMGFIAYKNSTKHYRILKRKLKNETGFTIDDGNPFA